MTEIDDKNKITNWETAKTLFGLALVLYWFKRLLKHPQLGSIMKILLLSVGVMFIYGIGVIFWDGISSLPERISQLDSGRRIAIVFIIVFTVGALIFIKNRQNKQQSKQDDNSEIEKANKIKEHENLVNQMQEYENLIDPGNEHNINNN